MRPISMERVEKTRENILGIITNKALTHEQKLTNLANAADGMLEVLDVPEGLDDLLNCDDEHRCICDLFEGHAPMRPRSSRTMRSFLRMALNFCSLNRQQIFLRHLMTC